MNRLFLAVAVAMAVCATAVADVGRQIGSGPDEFGGYTTEHILVRFERGQLPRGLVGVLGTTGDRTLDRLGAKWHVMAIEMVVPQGFSNELLADQLGLSRTMKFVVPRGTDVTRMIADYSTHPSIEFAEVDGIGGAAFTPNDPMIAQCWGMNNTGQTGGTPNADINAFEAWDTWTGGSNIILAVVDSGVSPHPDMNGKFVPGFNTNNNTTNTSDGLGHGTHVAGTAGAIGNNGIGVAGVSFGVKIMPMRVLSGGGSGTESQCGAGIVWAADHGANICTMSLQFYTGSQTFRDMVDYAHGLGVMLIAATGNNQGNVVAFPARFDNCYGVGATNHNDVRSGFSNYGPQNDVVAPGEDVFSTYIGNAYTTMSGTSMATPHISGLASMLWSFDPGLTKSEVFELITGTAVDKGVAGFDQQYGWGRANAQAAVLLAEDPLVRFTSMLVDEGSVSSGDVDDLYASDDVKVIAHVLGSRANQGIQLTATGATPSMTFNRVQVLVESSASSNNVVQTVSLWDFVGNAWVQVDTRNISTTEGYTRVNVVTDPARFVAPGTNNVSARVSFTRPGFTSRSWSVNVDQFRAALRMD